MNIGYAKALSPEKAKERTHWTPELIITKAESLLEHYNPDSFNARFFQKHNMSLYKAICRKFRSSSNENPFYDFVSSLSIKWQKRFNYRKTVKDLTLDAAVKKLEALVEELSPKSFGPKFIHTHSRHLKYFFRTRLQKNGCIQWNILVDLLKPEVKRLWKHTKPSDVVRLKRLLEKHNPKKFNSKWVFRQDKLLFSRLRYKITSSQRNITWEDIFKKLGNDSNGEPWINRSTHRRFYVDVLPKQFYHDPDPVEQILQQYRDKLYVFVEHIEKDDEVYFENITTKLINLAQMGNDNATDFLKTNLYFTAQRLVFNNRLTENQFMLSRLVDCPDKIADIITRCIYCFGHRSKFHTYLYRSMLAYSKSLGQVNISLDEEIIGQYEAGNLQVYGKAQSMYAGR